MPNWIEITSMDSFHGTYFDFPDVYSEYSLYNTGPRLNIKTVLSTYGDFHIKDKTAVRGIAIPGKTVFLIETAPWTFVREIIRWSVDLSHNVPVMRTKFSCNDVLIRHPYALG